MKLDPQYNHLIPKLYKQKNGYIKYRGEYLHRYLTNAKPGEIVDHINGDRTDNRLCNLRIVNPSQNSWNKKSWNSLGFKGVEKRRNSYRATICIEGKRIRVSGFKTALDAFEAYKRLAKKHFGEFARWN